MPSGHWGIGFALGLIAGISLMLFLIAAAGPTGQVMQTERDGSHQAEQGAEHSSQEYYLLSWWHHDGAFVSSKDTLAQWAMAFLGIIATGLSGWAVLLLRDTLRETKVAAKAAQDAVAVTRDIGERQVRAYVSFKTVEPLFGDGGLIIPSYHFIPIIRNSGQSPAKITALYSHILIAEPTQVPSVQFWKVGRDCS